MLCTQYESQHKLWAIWDPRWLTIFAVIRTVYIIWFISFMLWHKSCYVHSTNHSTNCEPSGIPNARSHIVKNFMVLSLAWRWLFMSKHVALTYAFIIQLCWLEYISIKWTYRINTQRDDFVQIVRRRLSVVCVVTTLWSGETWLRFPTEAITFSLLKNVQTWYGANPTP